VSEDLEYGVVFCGGGPAAIGPVVHAASEGRLDELLGSGVCIIERDERIGPGSIGHYPISANTQGATFLRALETDAARAALGSIWTDPATLGLQRLRSAYPRLPLVGAHLASLGALVEQMLASSDRCAVVTGHIVESIQLLPEGGVAVRAVAADGALYETTAAIGVIATGGRPRGDPERLVLPGGLALEPYAEKICHAAALIDDREALPAALAAAVRETGELVVVGGSHSAWSAAWLALREPQLRAANGCPPTVTVLHRSPVRLWSADAATARRAAYDFDAIADVCARTGMVHRYAGLRADARALARATLAGAARRPSPVRAIHMTRDPDAAARALAAAGAIAVAIGYEAAVPPIALPDGRPLQLARDANGLVVTQRAQVVTADGGALQQLLAYGLGAGLPSTGDLAGEPSYTGRVDAVRLYEAEAGSIVVDTVLARGSLVADGRLCERTVATRLRHRVVEPAREQLDDLFGDVGVAP
jgi:hypothetical protein